MMIQLPEKVRRIINTIMEAGYEAYAVGGCIRDSILGREPDDWDITTSATPGQVKELFSHTIDTGIQHGTVTVMLEREGFEVTTYRIDGKYEDGRHPKEVTFTPSLLEDLKRRDFTINAMAYNDEAGLVDVFGGEDDIKRKVIRCVGEPKERFGEDALRMMRAVRFSGQLGYEIEVNTSKAIRELNHNLIQVSAERIQMELVKLAMSPHPENLRLAYETGITQVILPEFDVCMKTEQKNPHHCYTVGEHILKSMEEIKPEKMLRLAMLFHDIGKPKTLTLDEKGVHHFHGHPAVSAKMARGILKRLKFDNQTIYFVTNLVKYHDYNIKPEPMYVRRAIMKIGEDIFPLLFEVKAADLRAQSTYMRREKEEKLKNVYEVYQQIISERQCVSIKDLAVTGKDLMEEAGMQAGPELGKMLNRLLDFVVEDPSRNEREILLKAVKEFK
ncbi:CCA tRNA nucleotidyltransferase [Parablautia muri]|uniref:CCA tRNA nucleotidyltransferase n=1 Tax=Parablautia muri TaxID=2320879 RepID=A0A9X5GQI0_9FIRM|nr:CCA tRNA nucleotidyltransferase [Parablautia muri]